MPSDSWDTRSAQAVRTQPFPVSRGVGGALSWGAFRPLEWAGCWPEGDIATS